MSKGHSEDTAAADNRQQLLDALGTLAEEVRVLREAVDELREEVRYGVRNLLDPDTSAGQPRRITSMPADPVAPDFADRVNRFRPEDLPPDSGGDSNGHTVLVDGEQFDAAIERLGPDVADALSRGETVPIEASRLADAMEDVEQLVYCCEQPKLQWYGDPDRPGISCANCGFPVAHEADILCWRGGDETAECSSDERMRQEHATPQRSSQRELF